MDDRTVNAQRTEQQARWFLEDLCLKMFPGVFFIQVEGSIFGKNSAPETFALVRCPHALRLLQQAWLAHGVVGVDKASAEIALSVRTITDPLIAVILLLLRRKKQHHVVTETSAT